MFTMITVLQSDCTGFGMLDGTVAVGETHEKFLVQAGNVCFCFGFVLLG